MDGYGCYHSLPARQRYVADNLWNTDTDADLKPAYNLTPLEADAISELRLDVQSINVVVATVSLFDPQQQRAPGVGGEV